MDEEISMQNNNGQVVFVVGKCNLASCPVRAYVKGNRFNPRPHLNNILAAQMHNSVSFGIILSDSPGSTTD